MKNIIALSLSALLCAAGCTAQSSDEKAIEKTIIGFSEAGDNYDVDKLANYLDNNFRIVMNRLFGSADVTVMSKEVYLEKIKTKEFGGDQRKVEIESIVLNGATACAKASFVGNNSTFVSVLTLVRDKNDTWKLLSEVPVAP